jgi:hypothetical protein
MRAKGGAPHPAQYRTPGIGSQGALRMQLLRMVIRRLTFASASLISLGIILATAVIHYAAGRSPICKCGYVKLFWWGPKGTAEESQHFLDIYSTSHVLHGMIFYFLLWLICRGHLSVWARLVIAVLLESGWELFENSSYIISRYQSADVAYNGDSIINSVGDILSMMAGFLIAARVPPWVSVLLLIGTELADLALIRDNLALNILNLIRPVEWITKWQEGG